MKAYRVGLSARAWTDLEEIRAYLGPFLAATLDAEMEVARERLSANPESAPRAWTRGGKRHPRYRRLVLLRTPYHLYYEVHHARQAIVILRVWHEKRRPPRL